MTTNTYVKTLVANLKKLSIEQKINLWKRVAKDLSKPSRQTREVNISRINNYTKDGEIIIVPGKVLSLGELDHKVTVAALNFSAAALEKINAKGKAIKIEQLMKDNPKASKVRIIG